MGKDKEQYDEYYKELKNSEKHFLECKIDGCNKCLNYVLLEMLCYKYEMQQAVRIISGKKDKKYLELTHTDKLVRDTIRKELMIYNLEPSAADKDYYEPFLIAKHFFPNNFSKQIDLVFVVTKAVLWCNKELGMSLGNVIESVILDLAIEYQVEQPIMSEMIGLLLNKIEDIDIE